METVGATVLAGLWAQVFAVCAPEWAWQIFLEVGVANFFFGSGRGKLFLLSVMGVRLDVANFSGQSIGIDRPIHFSKKTNTFQLKLFIYHENRGRRRPFIFTIF